MQPQAGLGSEQLYKKPIYDQMQIGRVTSVANYEKWGKIEVIFLDYSQPFPVWASQDIDRKPVEGDQVLVGFIQGRPDAPYLAGYVRNQSYTSNFLRVEKDRIIIQMPTSSDDIKEHMMDEGKKSSRTYIEVKGSTVTIHGGSIILGEDTAGVARNGDSVSVHVGAVGECTGSVTDGTVTVDVPGIGECKGVINSGTVKVDVTEVGDCTGKITSGSSIAKA